MAASSSVVDRACDFGVIEAVFEECLYLVRRSRGRAAQSSSSVASRRSLLISQSPLASRASEAALRLLQRLEGRICDKKQ